jgi:hypothetical protein
MDCQHKNAVWKYGPVSGCHGHQSFLNIMYLATTARKRSPQILPVQH